MLIRIIALAGLCAGCSGGDTSRPAAPAAPSNVVTLSAAASNAAGIQTAIAGQTPLRQVLTLTGTLAERPWTSEEQTALAEAENADAKLRVTEANLARLTHLASEGIASRQDLDAARADRDQARATASQADAKRANLGLDVAKSAFDPQAKIWGLANLSETDFARVTPGARVEVTTEAFPGRPFSGRVVAVSRSADPQTRTFTVRIAIDDPSESLRPQMLATFKIVIVALGGLIVPRSAILLEGDGSYVYVAEGRTFRKQRVHTGAATTDDVQLTDGVAPATRIVTRGAQLLESERLKSQLKSPDKD
jgi:multidrug efflux pump subunit AcrA (membrane-fusion protein)